MLYTRTKTILDAVKVAGLTNKSAFALAVILIFYCISTELHLSPNGDEEANVALSLYKSNFYTHWAVAYGLFFYATFFPLARVRKHPHGSGIFTFALIIYGVIATLLAFAGAMKLGVSLNTFLTAAIPSLALIFTLLILFVQLQISSNNSRTNHALNSLLQMRDSEAYNKSAETVSTFLSESKIRQFSEEQVELFTTKKQPAEKLSEDDKYLIEVMNAQLYILNYFEFLALGIKSHALDGELIYNSMAGIFELNMYRSKHFLNTVRRNQPKAFYCYIEIVKQWRPRWDFDNHKVEQKLSEVEVNKNLDMRLNKP